MHFYIIKYWFALLKNLSVTFGRSSKRLNFKVYWNWSTANINWFVQLKRDIHPLDSFNTVDIFVFTFFFCYINGISLFIFISKWTTKKEMYAKIMLSIEYINSVDSAPSIVRFKIWLKKEKKDLLFWENCNQLPNIW